MFTRSMRAALMATACRARRGSLGHRAASAQCPGIRASGDFPAIPDPGAGADAGPWPLGSLRAYEVLGVPRTAGDAEVKRAYRRQMSQNHPDKLVARGLPGSLLEVAKQKTQSIQAAWERIRESRGLR